MTHRFNRYLLNGLVILGIILTLLALAGTPFVLAAFFKASAVSLPHRYGVEILTAAVYVCAVPYVFALCKLKKICKLLFSEEALSHRVAAKFRAIGFCAFAEAALFLGIQAIFVLRFKIFLYALTVIPTFVFPFICVIIGFLSLVIAEVFRNAAEIKAENDATF